MQAIVYYPETELAEKELAEKVSKAYAEAVYMKIKETPCPLEQVKEILSEIKSSVLTRNLF